MPIVNIRGTSGSGKTYTVRELMKLYAADGLAWEYRPAPKEDGGHRSGYHVGTAPWRERPLIILGFYGGATCGGCDGVRTQLQVEKMIRGAVALQADVIFEGLLISHLKSRWATLPAELGVPWRFVFLDTTVEACVQRAIDRRIAAGNMKPFNPTNTQVKFRDIERRYNDFRSLGLDCVKVSSDDAARSIYAYLDPQRPCPEILPFRAGAGERAGESLPREGGPVDQGSHPPALPVL